MLGSRWLFLSISAILRRPCTRSNSCQKMQSMKTRISHNACVISYNWSLKVEEALRDRRSDVLDSIQNCSLSMLFLLSSSWVIRLYCILWNVQMHTFWLDGDSSMIASNPSRQALCTGDPPAKNKSITSCFSRTSLMRESIELLRVCRCMDVCVHRGEILWYSDGPQKPNKILACKTGKMRDENEVNTETAACCDAVVRQPL